MHYRRQTSHLADLLVATENFAADVDEVIHDKHDASDHMYLTVRPHQIDSKNAQEDTDIERSDTVNNKPFHDSKYDSDRHSYHAIAPASRNSNVTDEDIEGSIQLTVVG
jgi:hypothetical protein